MSIDYGKWIRAVNLSTVTGSFFSTGSDAGTNGLLLSGSCTGTVYLSNDVGKSCDTIDIAGLATGVVHDFSIYRVTGSDGVTVLWKNPVAHF